MSKIAGKHTPTSQLKQAPYNMTTAPKLGDSPVRSVGMFATLCSTYAKGHIQHELARGTCRREITCSMPSYRSRLFDTIIVWMNLSCCEKPSF
eukprot:9113174-Pyramimonas_sp.AAC.1